MTRSGSPMAFRRCLAVLAVGGGLAGSGAVAVALAPASGQTQVNLPLPRADLSPPDVSRAGPEALPCPEGALRIEPGTRIQDAVDKAPPGALFCIAAGRHRAQTILPKSRQGFFGEGGAVLDGTLDLADFRRAGDVWVAAVPTPPMPPLGICLPTVPHCNRPEGVFLDGQSLVQVFGREDLTPGHFMLDAARRVMLMQDPHGHVVSAIAARHAFMSNAAPAVTVANLVIENYASPPQHGAVFDHQDRQATGWVIIHNAIADNSGLGVLAGPKARILANRIERNGQLGVSASLDGALIEGNAIAGNNTRGFDPAWEAGGLKAAVATGLTIRGNDVRRNHGPGLWCDIECHDTLYEGNVVAFNDGAGIFHEISYAATIRDNIVQGNGIKDQGWYWGANILVAASQDVTIENNRIEVADGGTGIALVDQGRTRDAGGLYRTAGNRVVGNVLRFAGPATARMGGVSDVPPGSPNDRIIETGHNLFERNRYITAPGGTVAFGWGRDTIDFAHFQAIGQDRSSVVQPGP